MRNLRLLACGGDGTAGWVLSALDAAKIEPPPPVAILPLGTGNDLARVLNWGGGYEEEPLAPILTKIANARVQLLDRWSISVRYPDAAEPAAKPKELVMNNYCSFGTRSHVGAVLDIRDFVLARSHTCSRLQESMPR